MEQGDINEIGQASHVYNLEKTDPVWNQTSHGLVDY